MPAVRAGQRNPSFQIGRPHQVAGQVAVQNTVASWDTERLIGYVAVLVITAGLLFVEYPFLNYWLFPRSIGGRFSGYFTLLLWPLMAIVVARRLRRGKKLGTSGLFFLALMFLEIVLTVFRTDSSLRSAVLSQLKPYWVGLICYLIASDYFVRRFLARMIISINILNLALIFLVPVSFYALKAVLMIDFSRFGESTLEWLLSSGLKGGATGMYPYRSESGLLSGVSACLSFMFPSGSLISAVLLVLSIVGIVASRAISPTIGMVMGLIVITWKALRSSTYFKISMRRMLRHMVVVTALLAVILLGFSLIKQEAIHGFFSRFSFSIVDYPESLAWGWTIRIDNYRIGLSAILESPLWGWGEEGLRSYVLRHGAIFSALPHNILFYVTALNGVPYILMLGILIVRAFKGFNTSAAARSLDLGFLGAFISVLVVLMAHPQYLIWMLWILVGVGLALWEQSKKA